MTTKKMTIKEATQSWVREMNAIPSSLLDKAYPHMEDDGLLELTPLPTKHECNTCSEEFSQEEVDELEEKGHLDNAGNIICPTCYNSQSEDFLETADVGDEFNLDDCDSYIEEVEDDSETHDYGLPMWGWLWNPENIDEEWIRDNLKVVSNCGFRIYESDEVGILLGIDGAGYDFYEAHWIPLYEARGLQWHNTEE